MCSGFSKARISPFGHFGVQMSMCICLSLSIYHERSPILRNFSMRWLIVWPIWKWVCKALWAHFLRWQWGFHHIFPYSSKQLVLDWNAFWGRAFSCDLEAVKREGESILSLNGLGQLGTHQLHRTSGLHLRWIWLVSVNHHWFPFHC